MSGQLNGHRCQHAGTGHAYRMSALHIIFAVSHHQTGAHILNAPLGAGIAQDIRLAIAWAVQFCPGHKRKKAADLKMLQDPAGKRLWL